MTQDELLGLSLEQALEILRQAEVDVEIIYSDAPNASFDRKGRTPRVVKYANHQLLVSFFRDGKPEGS